MASLRTDPTAAAAAGSGDDRASWTCIGERTGWGASGWYAQLQEVEEGGAVYEVEVDRIQNEAAACCAADLLTMWDCHRNRRWPADPRRCRGLTLSPTARAVWLKLSHGLPIPLPPHLLRGMQAALCARHLLAADGNAAAADEQAGDG